MDDKSAEKFSCGACLAKRIFVSQYTDYPSAYKGGVLGVISPIQQTPHQDTLTKMFPKCIADNACTPRYLKETSTGKNPLEQALQILEQVGLGNEFKSKKVHFSRFEPQDILAGEKRPGIDITLQHKESQAKFDEIALKELVETLPENYVKTITFSIADVKDENHICSKIIASTNAKDHWNTLTFLINETELTKLFEEYNIHSKQGIHSITHGNGQYVCFWGIENKGKFLECVPKIPILP